jgi:hypothetical protein
LWTRLHTSGTLTAIIDVNGQLFPPRSTTCGTVHINEFDFLQAPFKSGDIQVDTNESGIQIGLRNIHGRGSDSAGTLNGRVSWTNKKLAGEGGPFVELSGNLEPWILAKCASDELGENLKNIQLPPSRTITVKAKPGAKNLEVDAEVNCTTDFTAWGIPCKDLLCKVDNKNESISIQSSLAIAEGIGALSITSEPGHDSKISVTLKDCDSNLIARGLGYTKIPVPKKGTPKDATRLNFTLNGTIDIKSPEQIRCLGSFDVANPEIKKIRILGGLSSVLEAIGIGATTYELTHLTGQFGCINGRAYFPNVLISGPQSQLNLAGEADIAAATVDFAGVFNIPQKESSIFPNPFNLNRTIADNTQITIKGPLSQPKIKATPSFFFFHKLFKINSLGKIPAELLE